MKSSQNGSPAWDGCKETSHAPEFPEPGTFERLRVSLGTQVEFVEFSLTPVGVVQGVADGVAFGERTLPMCVPARTS